MPRCVTEFAIRPWEPPASGEGPWAYLEYRRRRLSNAVKRSLISFVSAFVSTAGLYLVLAMIRRAVGEQHALLSPLFATIGVPLVILAAGVGSSIEVGLIGGYEEEDIEGRRRRASALTS